MKFITSTDKKQQLPLNTIKKTVQQTITVENQINRHTRKPTNNSKNYISISCE